MSSPAQSIQRAVVAIEGNLTRPLAVAALARRAGMSLWHFQRTFAVLVGRPVGAYIRGRRLTEAAHRLRTEPTSILEVGLDYQFESHAAFTRAFRAQFLYSPSAWRRGRGALNRPCRPAVLDRPRAHPSRMKLPPDIVKLPAQTYVGLQAKFIMVISPDANNLEVIPKLWREFFRRRPEIPPGADAAEPVYGLCQSPEAVGLPREHPDEAAYLAAMPLARGAAVPAGMVTWKVPARTYARFVHRGPVQTVGDTYTKIYGKWLGAEGYERDPGPDLERYGEKFSPQRPESEFDILIPVRPVARPPK